MEPEQLGIIRKATFGQSDDHGGLTLTLTVQVLSGTFVEPITDRARYEALLGLVPDVSRLNGVAVAVSGSWSNGHGVIRGLP